MQERYWQGIANDRPFQYWSWANFASVVCAIGLGSVAGIGRAFDIAAIRRRSGLHLVVLGALLAIVFADLSMLSKAETERIWLPFTVWLTAAGALLPPRSQRWWLAAQRRRAPCSEPPDSDELVTEAPQSAHHYSDVERDSGEADRYDPTATNRAGLRATRGAARCAASG